MSPVQRGVLDRERERREWWAARGLPDPIQVIAEEQATQRQTGEPFTSPKRGTLDAHFAQHPENKPPNW